VGRHVISGVDETSPGVWRIEVAGAPWLATDAEYGFGVDGIDVDLDAANVTGPLYRIVSNTVNTITVHTTDDLTGMAGRELIGVHTFATLQVLGRADVDFGGDRVIVNDLDNSRVSAGSTLRAGQVQKELLEAEISYRVPGVEGNGFHLPGVNSSIEVGGHADFNNPAQLTIAAWVLPADSAIGRDQYIIDYGNTAGYGLRLASDGRPVCNIYTGNNGWVELYADGPVSSGAWSHLACVYDGAQLRVLVDGVVRGARSAFQTVLISDGSILRIGVESHTGAGSYYFGGSLDSIRIHRAAIAEPMSAADDTGLILAYDFEDAGLVINDTSGNAHHGLLIGERGDLAGRLIVDDIDMLPSLNLGTTLFTTLEVFAPVDIENLSLAYGGVIFHGGLRVRNDLVVQHGSIAANHLDVGEDFVIEDADVSVGELLEADHELRMSSASSLTAPRVSVENAIIDHSQLTTAMITTRKDFIARTGSTLVIDTLQANGNIQLLTNSTLTVPNANATGRIMHALDVSADGTLTIDETSAVQLTGKGYPPNHWSGPDFTQNGRASCHGGARSNADGDCAYGRYEEARFAGAAGQHWYSQNTGAGGGFGRFEADTIDLSGNIVANGMTGYDGGAGGGVHLAARVLTGTGSVFANGGYGCCRLSGGGGRISTHVDDSSGALITFEARGGVNGSYIGGAGTVFLKSPLEPHGALFIDNGGHASKPDGTPMRQVGRHVIESAEDMGEGEWRLAVGGMPWLATDIQQGWGVDGLYVDLDAADAGGPRYRILRNERNALIVQSADDLSASVGSELVGVHIFQALTAGGGADVQFGDDFVEIEQTGGLSIEAGSAVHAAQVITH
ncbi:MAG TPA: LamG domain-containing protein, partial [Gammaproteobacteria bacterium]